MATGYVRIKQFADITEIYEYEKKHRAITHRRYQTALQKKRKKLYPTVRTRFSTQRAKNTFFEFVAHTLHSKGKPSMLTFTYYLSNVSYSQANKYLYVFFKNLKSKMGKTVSYIAVTEWQRKGRIHNHVLVWGIDPQTIKQERSTRNLQRIFGRGYLDARCAYDNSPKLASYLAKYFVKGYTDPRLQGRRAYRASLDLERPRAYGSNTLAQNLDLIEPDPVDMQKAITYNTRYLGKCIKKTYKKTIK